MKGADEYYDLFKGRSQQFGRLYLQASKHARGKCFEIKMMPEGMIGSGDSVSGHNVVEVYGVVSGQRGWTEAYGWIHKGKWQDDFFAIVERKKADRAKEMALIADKHNLEQIKAEDHLSKLLSDYA